MQYLLKLTLEQSPLWRLIAVDGSADRAHVAHLCALSFDYPSPATYAFELAGIRHEAGRSGEPLELDQLRPFDEFGLNEGEVFRFVVCAKGSELVHEVRVMKGVEHLFCLMPSCLVGQGLVPAEAELTARTLQAYFEQEDSESLDLRTVTDRLRSYGALRADRQAALINIGAKALDFKLLQ